mgnify:CR=1 FL=1
MKNIIRDVVFLVLAVVAVGCTFFMIPFVNLLKGYGLGVLEIVLPIIFVPLISFVLGVLYDRPIQLLYLPVTAIMSVIYSLVLFGSMEIAYIGYYILTAVIFMGIGFAIKFVVVKIVSLIRKKIPAKN